MDERTVLKGRIVEENNGKIEDNVNNVVSDENADNICVCTRIDIERKQYARVTNKCIQYKNLAVVISSFCLLFTAYLSLQNLQSSINVAEGLGTTGLTVVYVSVIICNAFLPTLLISKIEMKWSSVISMFGYLAYISAAFRATWVSIISSSVLLGVGTACLWTAEMAFITELAQRYSGITDSKFSDNLDRFFQHIFCSISIRLIKLGEEISK